MSIKCSDLLIVVVLGGMLIYNCNWLYDYDVSHGYDVDNNRSKQK